jgi:type VI secretion system protein ImpL
VLKYIVGLIFIALTWAAAFVFRGVAPLIWVAIILTVVVTLGLVTVDIVRVLTARRATAALEKGLSDQAGSEGIRPDQQAEIAAMQAEFQKALRSLRSSRLGHKGGDALGALPWYVIVGPPGAGKTTALRSSGLPFPHAKGGRVRGVGGTRNCDWWLTNDAVILDTAGRWATQEDDREEWLAFLDLLHQTRPQKPINGILVAVSLMDLQGEADEIADLSKALRERVDEVMGRLEMVLPVYLLVTKCDLVPGFVEMFGDLRDKERGQIWGFTLPLLSTADERIEMFGEHLDDLWDVIEQKAALRMCDERRVEARFSIFEFPQQLRTLRQALTDLVTDLFAENVYQDAPIMRGVYFTSGTQEGRPIDRMMKSMAEAFGVSARAAAVAVSKPKSYFLRDFFTEVVFPDKDVAIRSTRVLARQRITRLALTVCALVGAAGFLFLPVRSYSTNRDFIHEARRFVDKLAAGRQGREVPPLPSAATLESVETMAKTLETEGDGSVLFPLSAVIQSLRTTIARLVVRPILRADVANVSRLAPAELMDALVLHLLLTEPKQPDEPTPRTARWAEAAKRAGHGAAARWESLTGPMVASRAPRVVESLVRFYTVGIQDPADLIDRDRKFVSAARATLIGAGDDPLAELINDPAMPRDLKLVDVLGGAVVFFQVEEGQKRPGTAVRGAFTPAGYRVVKQRLEQLQRAQDVEEDAWILGKERKTKDAKAIARIKADYFVQYLGAWRAFLLTLAVREPVSLEQARVLCKRLTLEKPFDAIWRNLGENLTLKDESLSGKALGMLKGAADKAGAPAGSSDMLENQDPGPKQVAAEFDALLRFGSVKPSGLDQYNQILGEIASAMGDQGTPEPKAFQAVLRTQRAALSGLIARYNDRGWEQGLLERILMPPLRGVEVSIVGASSELANRKWCETVVVAYDELLAGKFPFAANKATAEARLADVEKFFQPATGVLWQYFTESLQAEIERVGSIFRVKEGASVRYKDDFLKFWSRAQDMSSRLFAKDPSKLGMPVEIHIHPSAQYSKIVLDSGSAKVVGLNAAERWDEILWPSRRALIRLYVRSDEVESLGPREDSDWALFHLLVQGASASRNGDVLSLSFAPTLGQGKVQIDFKPDVLREMFAHFVLPRSITPGSAACHR